MERERAAIKRGTHTVSEREGDTHSKRTAGGESDSAKAFQQGQVLPCSSRQHEPNKRKRAREGPVMMVLLEARKQQQEGHFLPFSSTTDFHLSSIYILCFNNNELYLYHDRVRYSVHGNITVQLASFVEQPLGMCV